MSDSSAIPWAVACQAPLYLGFPRQEYWSGLPFPSPGDLPYPGIKPHLLLARQFLNHWATRETLWWFITGCFHWSVLVVCLFRVQQKDWDQGNYISRHWTDCHLSSYHFWFWMAGLSSCHASWGSSSCSRNTWWGGNTIFGVALPNSIVTQLSIQYLNCMWRHMLLNTLCLCINLWATRWLWSVKEVLVSPGQGSYLGDLFIPLCLIDWSL